MTIADDRLKQFFSKQKVGAFNALKQPANAKPRNSNLEESKVDDKKILLNEVSFISEEGKGIEEKRPALTEKIKSKNRDRLLLNNITDNPLADRYQTVSQPLAIQEQSVSLSLAISKQSVSPSLSEPLAKPLAKSMEIEFTDLRIFSKKERDLLTLIFWQCHNNCSLTSPPISTEEIRHTLKISAERVRNLIFRVGKKGGLRVIQHRSGQNAYRVFELSKSLYQWMLDNQNNKVLRINDSLAKPLADPLADPLSDPLANSIYSNSSNIINKTTTSLPEDWKKINFESLNHIGFSETQLKQIFETNLSTSEIVQDSINHFSYGLLNSEKIKAYKEPLNVFMGVLRKGQRWYESDYVSPQDQALKQIVEEKRKAKEKRDSLIKELVDIEFPEWRKKLGDARLKLIVPEEVLKTNLSAAITSSLRMHYIEKILIPRLEKNNINVE